MPAIRHVNTMIQTLHPHAYEIQLGITFRLQVGALLAATASEANIIVTLKWDKEKQENQ
ncbi:CU044_2847 family protein [Ktedonosporobacter rubrisoli]|uniref:CU044_2847 family protein n=1 Tax=Ktedonosporobacter rubrisoli TaxID=2509675 RepID=UPI0013EE63CA|nr:CU044_2847 family protein [Ktedonosporobacter rubrisoli]